ncbi:hypothetical protein ACFLZ4_01275 [Patescibacteria group bacterium]
MKRFFYLLSSIIVSFTLNISVVYAADLENDPSLGALAGIFGNIFNIAVGLAGLVFVIMLGYGVAKASMALGDPEGLEGAKSTWTYALFGLFIVVGVLVIVSLIAGAFGVSSYSPGTLLQNAASALEDLILVPSRAE